MPGITDATIAGRERYQRERWNYPTRLTEIQDQVLVGSLLGDGALMVRSSSGWPMYTETHGAKQAAYLGWKAEVFAPFRARVQSPRRTGGFGGQPGQVMVTGRVPAFIPYFAAFYGSGKKRVPFGRLVGLDALGMAVWFQDDGSLQVGRHFILCTDGFDRRDHLGLLAWFRWRWGVEPVMQPIKGRDDQHRLRFRVNDTQTLLRAMEPHLHPLFRAKWRLDDPATWRHAMTKEERAAAIIARKRASVARKNQSPSITS